MPAKEPTERSEGRGVGLEGEGEDKAAFPLGSLALESNTKVISSIYGLQSCTILTPSCHDMQYLMYSTFKYFLIVSGKLHSTLQDG